MTAQAARRPLMTVPETAALLRIGQRTLYRLLDRGEIVSYRVAGTRRVDPDSVDQYLAGHRTEPQRKG